MDTTTKPDAILFPFGWDPGGKHPDREGRIHDYLEETLGAKPVWVGVSRFHEDETGAHWKFAFPNRHDTFNHPTGHPREKTPRYDWADQPNGARFGALKPDAWRAGPGLKPQAPPPGTVFPAVNPLEKSDPDKAGDPAERPGGPVQ